jgi:hypothetical protein
VSTFQEVSSFCRTALPFLGMIYTAMLIYEAARIAGNYCGRFCPSGISRQSHMPTLSERDGSITSPRPDEHFGVNQEP